MVESGISGGALITADIACSYNRDVLAVPGRPDDQWSAGCNNLIKTNKAALVESSADIEYFLNWKPENKALPQQTRLFENLGEDEKTICELLAKNGEMTIDSICRTLNIPVHRLSSILLNLEFSGVVRCQPGNLYHLN